MTRINSLLGVIGLYILIDLEIHVVFINSSKIYRFLKFSGLVFTNPEVFLRIWVFVFLTKKIQKKSIYIDYKIKLISKSVWLNNTWFDIEFMNHETNNTWF